MNDQPEDTSPESTKTEIVVRYPVTEAEIEAARARYAAVTFDTKQNYAEGVKAIAFCRETRTRIEARRKELKADSLAYGRKVDAVARNLTTLVESFEDPLRLKKKEVDDESARLKAEEERLEREKMEAEIQKAREAEEARLRELREAEEKRIAEDRAKLEAEKAELERQKSEAEERDRKAREERDAAERAERERVAAEQKAEGERLAAERARLDEEQRQREAAQREADEKARKEREAEEARLKAEREKLETEKREIAAAKEKADREEFERQAKVRAEEEARARLEREAVVEAERKAKEAEDEAAEAARLEALKPDLQRVRDFTAALRGVRYPTEILAPEVRVAVLDAQKEVHAIADRLDRSTGAESAEAAAE